MISSLFQGQAMLQRHLDSGNASLNTAWQELGEGAPSIIGFANLCSLGMKKDSPNLDGLTPEALALLSVARNRGLMDIRASKESMSTAQRLLAVCIELADDKHLLFLSNDNPKQTIRFLNGFRELCLNGLIMHHLNRDFSLTHSGFELAEKLNADSFRDLIQFATEVPI